MWWWTIYHGAVSRNTWQQAWESNYFIHSFWSIKFITNIISYRSRKNDVLSRCGQHCPPLRNHLLFSFYIMWVSVLRIILRIYLPLPRFQSRHVLRVICVFSFPVCPQNCLWTWRTRVNLTIYFFLSFVFVCTNFIIWKQTPWRATFVSTESDQPFEWSMERYRHQPTSYYHWYWFLLKSVHDRCYILVSWLESYSFLTFA